MKSVERAYKFIICAARIGKQQHCWLPLLNFVSGLRLNTIPRSASAAYGRLEDHGLRSKVELVGLRSNYLFCAFLLSISLLEALLFLNPSLLGFSLGLILSLLLFKELVLATIFRSHSSYLHGLYGSVNYLIALLEHTDITGEFISVVISG